MAPTPLDNTESKTSTISANAPHTSGDASGFDRKGSTVSADTNITAPRAAANAPVAHPAKGEVKCAHTGNRSAKAATMCGPRQAANTVAINATRPRTKANKDKIKEIEAVPYDDDRIPLLLQQLM